MTKLAYNNGKNASTYDILFMIKNKCHHYVSFKEKANPCLKS